jgi:hypothetical protein
MIATATSFFDTTTGLDLSTTLGLAVTVMLLAMLVQRELVSAAGTRLQTLSQYLSLTIAPLLVIFGVIVIGRLMAAY